MVALAPGDESSTANPLLDAFTAAGAFLADPFSLEFQIFNVTNDAVAAVQVFPVTPGDRQAVDLVLHKLGTGHFAAVWTVAGNASLGRYEIRWFLVQEDGAAERRWRRQFDVLALASDPSLETYALVADVREEGAPSTVSNRRILEALARGAELIREWTGYDFTARAKALKIDGVESLTLPLNEPVCAVESITYEDGEVIDRDAYAVYNRHLSQEMHAEDDRDNSRVEFKRTPGFIGYPHTYSVSTASELRSRNISRAQELTITGVFGYTSRERNGCPVGVTPSPIRRANVLLALRDMYAATSQDAFDAANAGKVKKQRTREQEIEWDMGKSGDAASGQYAPFTGDPEIDRILLTYRVPLSGTGL